MRCTKIVGGLLAFAREHKPERRMVSVNDVIMESYKLKEYELRVDNIDFELELSSDIPATSADPHQIQQVFINLINNAYDALKEKSRGILNIRSYKKDETILIELENNGSGIPKENINRIYDPFFTTKKVGEGTGLGLSIIYGIINEHNGKMYVESEIDKGTKFTIELPILKEVVEIDEVEIERPKKPEGTISVLVVEDEDSLRNYISETLSIESYVVETASSGEKAVELLKRVSMML
jgi:C4-dicarboxylate-specific signal transduction histidine kinase